MREQAFVLEKTNQEDNEDFVMMYNGRISPLKKKTCVIS